MEKFSVIILYCQNTCCSNYFRGEKKVGINVNKQNLDEKADRKG
jgi:hypothetical protein